MPKAILGTKLGMTQIFSPEGKIIPVTVVQAGPCRIAQVKTEENDGYTAIQLGYGALKPVQVNKPLQGHCEKAGIEPVKFFREVRTKDVSGYQPGDTVSVDMEQPPRPDDARFEEPSPPGQRRREGPGPRIQGQAFSRPDGRRKCHRSEPGSGQSGCGTQPDVDPGRAPRPEEGAAADQGIPQTGLSEKGGQA